MVTYTSSSTYWSPLKPRIRIYALQDTTYAAPIYSYNPFTDVGETTKPIALAFDSQTTNAGTFSIEIEDKDTQLDPDTFTKGNRVFIDCSKDGTTFQPAFKGLVRATEQNIYATGGRNIILEGYSYLVRLNERVVNTIKESTIIIDGQYDRTDSTMFTNNLIDDLLTTDSHYVYSADDTDLYSIFKKNNITSSPIVEWIPRLDAQLVTLNEAINSILESSNGLVMLNPADDELNLYTSDLVTPATSIFLLTNQINQNADDADYTMYPLAPYKYNVSYDYPDSGSRLIGSIGFTGCGGEEPPSAPGLILTDTTDLLSLHSSTYAIYWSSTFEAGATDMGNIDISLYTAGNCSDLGPLVVQIYTASGGPGEGDLPISPVGSEISLYKDRDPGASFPSTSGTYFHVGRPAGTTGTPNVLSIGSVYHVRIKGLAGQTYPTHHLWISRQNSSAVIARSNNAGASWFYYSGSDNNNDPPALFCSDTLVSTVTPPGISPACGGSQALIDADNIFAVAQDNNMSNRLGVVERVITGIPASIKTKQSFDEYLCNQLYFAAKPRFTFDFPSVSMPNKMPKAGDIVAHVDSMAGVGTTNTAIQTGVISSVQYDFSQGTDGALGIRRIGLTTTGIKRGSY